MTGSFALFTAPETVPFGVAFAVILGIAVLEGVGAFTAGSPSQSLEYLLTVKDVDGDGIADGPLGWLHVGKVPLLVLIILFLLGFALGGYALQMVVKGVFGGYAPALLASVPALLVGLSTVRGLGALIVHIIPRDETSALSEETFIGRAGVLMGASASAGKAGQVRLRDAHGRSHYLMVEPDIEGEMFDAGAQVLIVKKVGATYRGIRNPHPGLL
ncbi:MAG: YqiJ family protein [Gammaproteobacteria bacterium]